MSSDLAIMFPLFFLCFVQIRFLVVPDLPIATLNSALATMSEQRQAPDAAAQAFLKANPSIWKAWLPAEVATRVESAL